jgi:hypothetical protein
LEEIAVIGPCRNPGDEATMQVTAAVTSVEVVALAT